MPKLKTKRSAAKRFRKTKSGQFKYKRSNKRHILTSKGPKKKRHLRQAGIIHKADHEAVRRTMPYA